MNRKYGPATYTTLFIEDREAGSAGLELLREEDGKLECAATILFWDASGQFHFRAVNSEIPLTIVEELIAEAKATIKIK